jgi:hypothetical protein
VCSKNVEGNEEDDVPHASTDIQTDADSVDLEANATEKSLSPTLGDREVNAMDIPTNDVVLRGIDCEFAIPTDQELDAGSEELNSTRKVPTQIRRKFPWQKKSPLMFSNDIGIPALNDECKEEEKGQQVPKLSASSNFVSAVSFRQDESEGLDDDDDVCAICLNGYSKFWQTFGCKALLDEHYFLTFHAKNLQKMERPLFLRNIATISSTKTASSSGLTTTTSVHAVESIW